LDVAPASELPDSGPVEFLSAVTLAVSDMSRSVGFYAALGFRTCFGGASEPFTSFAVGDGYLNLQLDPDHAPIPRIWGRVIFWVDDVDAMYERVCATGAVPEAEPADAVWGERYFHVLDPDGHELSFARRLD
jgi:catechol 2,3-dioxygenase-like lactoylglutathione lyase family enzyme